MPGVLIPLPPQTGFQTCIRLRDLLVLAHQAQCRVRDIAGVIGAGIDQPPDVIVQKTRRVVALVGAHCRGDEMLPAFLIGGSCEF